MKCNCAISILQNKLTQEKNRLLFRFIGWFFLTNTLLFWLFGSTYLISILSSGSLFLNSFINCNTLLGKFIVCLFAVLNYLCYLMFLAFIPALIIFLLTSILPKKSLVFFSSILLATVSLIVLIIDTRIFSMYKFHINETIISFILSTQWREVFDLSTIEVTLMLAIIAGIILIEIIIAWFVWKKIILPQRFFKAGKIVTKSWFSGVIFCYFVLVITVANNNNLLSQQIPNLPLYTKLISYTIPSKDAEEILMRYSEQSFAQPLFPNSKLNYPLHPLQCSPPQKPYNIIFIMVDSLRFDSLSHKIMPNLAKFAANTWQFQHHLSAGNATQPGMFSLFYSISSNYWTATLKQKKRPVLFEVLEKYGYSIKIIWSAEMINPPFDKTIYTGLPNLESAGAPGDDPGEWDRHTTKMAIKFLTSDESKQPFFLQLFYDAPHGFCSYQSFPIPFQPSKRFCTRIVMTNNLDPIPYYNRYLNAAHFDDAEIGQVLNTIKKNGYLKNTIIVFTSDHGQEFNDNHQNYWGHSSNFTDAEVQVPMLLYWPGEKAKKIEYLTSSYDVVPTLLMRLFSCKNQISDYSIGQNLLNPEGRLPFILAGSYINMGIIEADRITTLETSGRITITDKTAKPLPNAAPRIKIVNQALVLLRKYFKQ